MESLTRGLGNVIPAFVVAALPRLSTGVDDLDDLATFNTKSTTILAVTWITAYRVATCISARRVAVVVSVDATLEEAVCTLVNPGEVVSQESLDSKNTIKVLNFLAVPSPVWRILSRNVGVNKGVVERRVRLHHDPVHVEPAIRVGVGKVGWIIVAEKDFLVRICEEVIVDIVHRLQHEGSEVNQNCIQTRQWVSQRFTRLIVL